MVKRSAYLLPISLTILMGLASRKFSLSESWIHLYMGDVLWATLFYFVFRFLFVHKTLIFSLLWTILWSFSIEFLQLYHVPWIDNIRNTTLGGLILGFGFLWSDLICYIMGALSGFFIDKLWILKNDNF